MNNGSRSGLAVAALILVAVLLLGAAAFMLWRLFFVPTGPTEPPREDRPVEQLEVVPGRIERPAEQPEAKPEPELGPEPGQQEEHLYGTLRLAYDKRKLESASEDPKTRVTLLLKDGEPLPRFDAQALDGPGISDSERQRLAVGLLQAYYADPPATEDVAIAPDPETELAYTLAAPAVGETQPMAARVRFLPAGTKLWYVILLYPDAEEPDAALLDAWEGAHIDA